MPGRKMGTGRAWVRFPVPVPAFRFPLSAFRFFLQYSARLFMVMMGENINARRVR